MATRKELAVIQAARSGEAAAQVALGKQYLFGGVGLPKNLTTALYWLDRAAQQHEAGACELIAAHIPFAVAVQAPAASRVQQWYEKAYDAGDIQAGVVFARLVLSERGGAPDPQTRHKALVALETAAHAGMVDAQLLLMQQFGATSYLPAAADSALKEPVGGALSEVQEKKLALEWARRAAENGAVQAQRALAAHAWSTGDMTTFLRWALPVARQIAADQGKDSENILNTEDVLLLSRCAETLFASGAFDAEELERFWALAAHGGDRDAQFSLGLWCARADARGNWTESGPRYSSYKQATHWLTSAGEQGIAAAWTALAKILRRPNAGMQGWEAVRLYLERAAEAGDCAAQLELGTRAWRARTEDEENDIRAAYWLQKAATQGSTEAQRLLKKIVSLPVPAPWAMTALQQLGAEKRGNHPFVVARIELAALFGLSFPEAFLLDLNTADRRHCLLVDICGHYGRTARRLVLIETIDERRALSRIVRVFANIDCSQHGPEGNYQRRLYLFRKLVALSEDDASAMFRPQIKKVAVAGAGM